MTRTARTLPKEQHRTWIRSAVGVLAGVSVTALLTTSGLPAAQARRAAPAADRTTAAEALRVDRVPTPTLHWTPCRDGAECTSARLPLDYDEPQGGTVTVALLRRPARDAAHRIGSLFVNPGGPGGSATELVANAPGVLSQKLLDRFDVVGVDPRGVGASQQVRCFTTARAQQEVLAGLPVAAGFPSTPAQAQAAINSARRLGRACSSTGRPLSAAMSTAEVARDLDVLRRAVGDTRLSYLGVSYGTYLGQVYANLFPDRVRAMALDGIIDPQAWAGTPATAAVPVSTRMGSDVGAHRALAELMTRCRQAGAARCSFAGPDPMAAFDRIAERLKDRPVQLPNGSGVLTYPGLVGEALDALSSPTGYLGLIADLTDLAVLTDPQASTAHRAAASAAYGRRLAGEPGAAPPAAYDSQVDATFGVLCTDGLNARDAGTVPAAAAAAERQAKHFGSLYAWRTVPCADRTWTAVDEDAYRGPFTRRTASPVLIIGNLWDPATNVSSAVRVSQLLPGSRLLLSDSWGHTAFGSSACITNSVDDYLAAPEAPPTASRCRGDVQPFAPSAEASQAARPTIR